MIRILTERIIEGTVRYIEASGLSTDTKPTAGIATGSSFLEVDTSDVYFFDETGAEWNKAGGASNA